LKKGWLTDLKLQQINQEEVATMPPLHQDCAVCIGFNAATGQMDAVQIPWR
jgi:hypothetical protein